MNPSREKREIESGHFKVYRSQLPDFPEGEVWHQDNPDFLVHTRLGAIGVEHSNFSSRRLQAR